jgi:hypothetical protein
MGSAQGFCSPGWWKPCPADKKLWKRFTGVTKLDYIDDQLERYSKQLILKDVGVGSGEVYFWYS